MAEDIQKELILKLQVKQFALHLDQSTLRDNEAILLAYVRYKDVEGPRKEMLFARSPRTDTEAKQFLNDVAASLKENNIQLTNIIACAIDDAPSMTGRYKGSIAYLQKAIPEVFCIHCWIHRQHLVAKK